MSSGSPFDPSIKFPDMELAYPSDYSYRRSGTASLFGSVVLVIAGLITFLVAVLEYRLPAGVRIIDPSMVVGAYLLLFFAIRWGLALLMPAAIFLKRDTGELICLERKPLGEKQVKIAAGETTSIEMVIAREKNGNATHHSLTVVRGGQVWKSQEVANRMEVRQGAEKLARALNLDITLRDFAGEVVAVKKPGEMSEPLVKKLRNLKSPMKSDTLLITKTKEDGKIVWEIALPFWISIVVFLFAIGNLTIGGFIWFKLEGDIARWGSLPFLFSTFVVFIAAAVVNTMKRPVELSMAGVLHRGMLIPLHTIENLVIVSGIFPRVDFISAEETFSVLMTLPQAQWMKDDIEFELLQRRGQILNKNE